MLSLSLPQKYVLPFEQSLRDSARFNHNIGCNKGQDKCQSLPGHDGPQLELQGLWKRLPDSFKIVNNHDGS